MIWGGASMHLRSPWSPISAGEASRTPVDVCAVVTSSGTAASAGGGGAGKARRPHGGSQVWSGGAVLAAPICTDCLQGGPYFVCEFVFGAGRAVTAVGRAVQKQAPCTSLRPLLLYICLPVIKHYPCATGMQGVLLHTVRAQHSTCLGHVLDRVHLSRFRLQVLVVRHLVVVRGQHLRQPRPRR